MEEHLRNLNQEQKTILKEAFEARKNMMNVFYEIGLINCLGCAMTPKVARMWTQWAINNELL